MEEGGFAMGEVVTVDVAMGRLACLEGYGLAVHPERCVRVRNRHASCARCAQACTSGAIALHNGALTVEQGLCVGCGTCATVCPTCAIEARHPADAEVLAAARRVMRVAASSGGPVTVTFACQRAFAMSPGACAAAGAIELACLSRMEESLAMRLFADGVRCVRLLHGQCAGCPRENGFSSVRLVRDTVAALLETWGMTCEYDVQQVFTGAHDAHDAIAAADDVSTVASAASAVSAASPSSANEVGDGVSAPPASASGDAAMRGTDIPISPSFAPRKPAHVQADGTLPHFVPLRRHALLDALADFGAPPKPTLDTRLWGHVSIDMRKCKSCKMCAVFCPTGSLQKYVGEGGHGGVEHYPAECVHCGLCQDICPAGAITSSTAVPSQTLADGKTERYPMPDPAWTTGPDQILRKMTPQIHSQEVQHSY